MISKHTSSIVSFLNISLFLLFLSSILFATRSLAAITCLESKEGCIEGQGEIRNIEGLPIDPGCWKKKVTYVCREEADNYDQIYDTTKDEEHIAKDNQLIGSSKDIITGNLVGDITCIDDKEKKENHGSASEQKTCNEEARPIKRICEKVPQVIFIDDPYPECQKHTSPPSIEDCLASIIQIPHYMGTGYGRIVVPKNRGARVGFSDSRHPYYYITATNETTGKVVIPRRRVSNGYYIELPVSKTEDQTFSFIVERWEQCTCNQPGRMNIYINYMSKMPKIEWKEELCSEA